MTDKSKSTKEVDIYRDTSVRYLGYANEIGESFRSKIGPKWVLASYGLATIYVIADTADKTVKMYNKTKSDNNYLKKTALTGTDAFLWQMLASVFVPGFTINRICAFSNYMLRNRILIQNRREWVVTWIGLSAIPFIIKPIDHMIDKLMDNTFRKFVDED